ncbi:MAG: 3-hydroxyacyl-CoA dehydrogenase [Deltaproteobacteria bacterium HGW-Deltaproteobacteria-14]|jgi:3-hydroxyacyl-CoA dehydrogenase/enoyl-CoA hydratase/3-hydroxybutyryl-CoA epimerase|nr:MAG: 3-hydroxyacyl-CoA dehydrogenase [Deltaproteobacteria bacterium HGW-Deltaproteobacteria-14]
MITDKNDAFELSFDPETGIATLALAMAGRVNKVDEIFARGLDAGVDWAKARAGLKGVILTSAHKNFCVGADIDGLVPLRDAERTLTWVAGLNRVFRKLETMGVPVACALVGSALGGGYEVALACHHRVALDSPKVQIGLPEVSLGVIPGAGGTQRLPRLVGIQKALEHITMGQPVRAAKAYKLGLVEALAPTREAVVAAARQWILDHPRKTRQAWDEKGYVFPAPAPDSEDARNIFMAATAMIFKKTVGTMPQVEAVVSAMQEGIGLTFDRALEVENRHFVRCAISDQSKDMIRTFWYFRNAAMKADGLPSAETHGFKKVGILGAGMMGAGLAFICAQRGLEVVLKDIVAAQLEAGEAHCVAEANGKKHLDAGARQAILDRITYSLDVADLAGCDLVIEAVLESDTVKHAVTREIEPLLAAGGVWASNTSAIPITHLATAAAHPDRFIGLHFFSPVEKMPLLEIIRGELTSDLTIGRAVRFAQDLGKIPVLVNDGYGFFTSRVFATYLMEAVQMVAEGHDPVLIEWAARRAGMVVPPLKVYDEVTLRLGLKAVEQAERYTGVSHADAPAIKLLHELVDEHGRIGKIAKAGFYDYAGKERRLWPGLGALVGDARPAHTGVDVIADRLMLIQVAEVARCLEEGILREKRDAEIASIFGIGFAPSSGGPLAWIDRRGVARVVEQLTALAAEHGPRFTPPRVLVDMAARGERFFAA